MRLTTTLLALLLLATPTFARAQQPPTTPPRPDSVRPQPRLRWQRPPLPPRWQQRRVPWQQPRGWMAPIPRPRANPPGAVLLLPRVREELGLTQAQVERVRALHEEFRTGQRGRLERLREQQRQLREEQRTAQERTRDRMRELLTPEQRQKLDSLREQRLSRRPAGAVPARRPRR